MLFAIHIPHLGLTAAVAIQAPDRSGEPTPRHRTQDASPIGQTHKSGVSFPDASSRVAPRISFTPNVVNDRPTVPARDSVEEAWLSDVRRGVKTIGDVIRDAERLRDIKLRNFRAFGGSL